MLKKPKAHRISKAIIEKRRSSSWNLYLRLRGDRYKNFVISDEVWSYFSDNGGLRKIQYFSRNKTTKNLDVFYKERRLTKR